MQQQLINLNPDLKKLWDEGFEIEVRGGHLLAHRIPYVSPSLKVQYGSLVAVLTYATPTKIGAPPDHTIFFSGETPCNADGAALIAIINNSQTQQLTETITVNHYFSSKPRTGNYPDYYEKVRTYAEILSAQAKAINPTVTSKPNKKGI